MVRNARTRNASADNRHDGATRLATGVLSRCHAALLHLIATQIAFLVRRVLSLAPRWFNLKAHSQDSNFNILQN